MPKSYKDNPTTDRYQKRPMDATGDLFVARYTDVINGETWDCSDKYYLSEISHEEMETIIRATAKSKFPKSITIQ